MPLPRRWRTPATVARPAYAKVNLALEVTGRRPDGFHELASVVVTIDWHDLVTVRTAVRGGGTGGGGRSEEPVRVVVDGPTAAPEMAAPTSLVARAAAAGLALARRVGAADESTGVDVAVRKRLPVAAGLGGGSADAAATLTATLVALRVTVAPATLLEVAAGLGSDVPAVLAGGAHMVAGRGEVLSPLVSARLHMAVAVAGASSTPLSYGALTPAELRHDGRARRVAAALAWGGVPDAADLGSALEAPACRAQPTLRDGLARLRDAVPQGTWHLTGSGGAAFALTDSHHAAVALAELAGAAGFWARACRTVDAGATVRRRPGEPSPSPYNRRP